MGGQSTHLPLKVNVGGVIPVIFASSILTFPQTFGLMFEDSRFFRSLTEALGFGEPLYNLLYVTFIIFFCYFYTSIVFNPTEVAGNMRKYGGFIPGIRPGRATAEYIETILTRITFAGALYLAMIAVIPEFMITGFHINNLPWVGGYFEGLPNWILNGMGVQFYFGGTSLLIVVGVAMDTVQQIEAQLVMRHYDGFWGRGGVGYAGGGCESAGSGKWGSAPSQVLELWVTCCTLGSLGLTVLWRRGPECRRKMPLK